MSQNKHLTQIFKQLNLDETLETMFSQAVVERIKVYKDTKEVAIYIELNQILYEENIDKLSKKIEEQFNNSLSIKVYPKYNVIDVMPIKQVLFLYWENISYAISRENPGYGAIIKNAKWEYNGNILQLEMDSSLFVFLRNKKIDKYIQDKLKDELNVDCAVDFKLTGDANKIIEEFEQEQKKKREELVKEVMVNTVPSTPTASQNEQKTNKRKKNVSEYTILGRDIDGLSNPIKEISEEIGEAIIEGVVMSVDAREITLKSEKQKGEKRIILCFDVTDYTDSVTVKCFLKNDVYEDGIKDHVKKGCVLKIKGVVQYDNYAKEIVVGARSIEKSNKKFKVKEDTADIKRVELHAHTQMSEMDALVSVKELVKRAAQWGHPAVAVTDHGVVQSFPDAAKVAKDCGIKVIYGVEGYIIDDLKHIVQKSRGQSLEDTYVVFDLETTGFSPEKDKIIEIGAVKIKNGEIESRFSKFVNPEREIPYKIVELTGINDSMVEDSGTIKEVLPEFLEYVGDAVLVAHNANFDVGFIRHNAKLFNIDIANTVVDTLELSRTLITQIKRHRLNTIAKYFGISLENHHRAVDDAEATAQILLKLIEMLKEKNIDNLDQLNSFGAEQVNYNALRAYHAIILVKDEIGLKNLYELVSISHIKYYHRRPRIPKSIFSKYREGLILGTACEAGELFAAIKENQSEERIEELINYYDYLEIQPIGNNEFMIAKGLVDDFEDLKEFNRKIVQLGEKYNKLVVATCDVHFMDPEDDIYRKILMAAKKFDDADNQPPLYFRTTDEMLKEFAYLGQDKAKEVVVENTNKINDMIKNIKPIPDGTFTPHIEGSEEELRKITTEKAISMYGDPLPKPVQSRLDRELNSIIENGYAVLYIIAQKLVWKSLEDGYLVGSRGSVGSSFVATMATITEVNPLAPHYYCSKCKYSDFDSEEVVKFAGGSGCDMPDRDCPECGERLIKDGHDIPFETFLGFNGDKEPDIDLNFSGEYQPRAHAYTEELFGSDHVFRAGTIGTLAEKTAYGFVKKYLDEREITVRNAEINRLLLGCTGVKRTTGQHPGGQMVVPAVNNIYQFCPVQRPANDVTSTITTTHFDYHSISGRLLKLDILGHDDPTVIKMLEDLTGINAQEIPLDDKKTMSLFTSTEALGITKEDINSEVGTFGLPEFGTKFVRQMLIDTQPKTFSDLIRISGLSHGTDVWLNNAQELIRQGTATLSETISTRDDIMVYLIIQGVEKGLAFTIMEKVRKGKGLKPEDEEAMKEAGVPDWYIWSCKQIKYMFPKAHAAAYVMMCFRIAYFKVNYPESFYTAFFTIRADDFDYEMMCNGKSRVQQHIKEIEEKGNEKSTKEKNILTILEIVLEMYCRGIKFLPIDLYTSEAINFQVKDEGILPPLNAIQGLGDTAAYNIVEARKDGEFLSLEEIRKRTKVSKTVVDIMVNNGIIQGLPETNQLSLF